MVQTVFNIIKDEDLPMYYKVGKSIITVAQYLYKTQEAGTPVTKESVRSSEAGQSIKAAIQARFSSQNSILLAKFDDLISKEEDKLPNLVRMSTRLQFIKYKEDFYATL